MGGGWKGGVEKCEEIQREIPSGQIISPPSRWTAVEADRVHCKLLQAHCAGAKRRRRRAVATASLREHPAGLRRGLVRHSRSSQTACTSMWPSIGAAATQLPVEQLAGERSPDFECAAIAAPGAGRRCGCVQRQVSTEAALQPNASIGRQSAETCIRRWARAEGRGG